MRVTNEMIMREVAGESILIPVGKLALKVHGMISLSESGAILWTELQQGSDEDALVAALLNEYDVDEETARQDVEEFLEKLRSLGVLVEE